jgi:hypothetical protein
MLFPSLKSFNFCISISFIHLILFICGAFCSTKTFQNKNNNNDTSNKIKEILLIMSDDTFNSQIINSNSHLLLNFLHKSVDFKFGSSLFRPLNDESICIVGSLIANTDFFAKCRRKVWHRIDTTKLITIIINRTTTSHSSLLQLTGAIQNEYTNSSFVQLNAILMISNTRILSLTNYLFNNLFNIPVIQLNIEKFPSYLSQIKTKVI